MPSLADAIGIGLSIVGEEHLLSSFLSSPGTVRLLTGQKDPEGLRTDLNIALILGLGFAYLMAFLLKSGWTAWIGTGFGVLLYVIYKKRAGL